MRESLHEPVRSYQSKHSFKKAFRRIACVLGCIVAFITTYALILPAITLEQTAFCGIEEHTHNESCYGQQIENRNLVCTAGLELHIHSAECYAADSSVICGQADYIVHSHDSSCWNTSGELICTLPERTQHVHDTGCYYTPEPVPHSHSEACVVNVMGDLVCTQQVSEGHKHGDSCYQTTDELVCTKVAEHTHIEECYDSEGLLCCALEENHVHDHTCYRQELICQTPESEGHSHDDNCYLWEQGYSCGLEEGQPEAVEPQLVCNEAVATAHVHDDSCFEVSLVDAEPVCGQTHEHTYSCYPLICALTEHTHELQCYSDPNADVENRQVWEATMQNVELTGDWCADVVAIAESQLGYTESTRNYQVGADNAIYGYTRYGDWYGSPYGDWCAMFVSFCLDYAQVEDFPQEANCPAWVSKLQEREMYAEADGYIPAAGDVIFFDWNANGLSDHVGIVAEVDDEKVKTIEGNSGDTVRYNTYSLTDDTILGYGLLPEPLSEEALAQVAAVISMIEAMPSADEIDTKIEEFEIAKDYEGEEAWLTEVYQQVGQTYLAYIDLGEELQTYVTNREKLLELEYIWSVLPLANGYVWLDGTNGTLMAFEKSDNTRLTLQVGQDYVLPETWNSPAKYNYALNGWYDITTGTYYEPGDTLKVQGNHVLYADWMAGTYDVGVFNEHTVDSLDTNSFITTHVFDYSNIFNMYSTAYEGSVSSSGHTEKWDLVRLTKEETNSTQYGTNNDVNDLPIHGNHSLGFIFRDWDNGDVDISYPVEADTDWNKSSTGSTSVTTGILNSDIGTGVWDMLFFPGNTDSTGQRVLGKKYVGTGNYLYQYMEEGMSNYDGEHNGYYYYDSTKNAASYNQTNARFYIYDYLERTSDSLKDGVPKNTAGAFSDFLPFNSPYVKPSNKTINESYKHPSTGQSIYQYDAKYNGQSSVEGNMGTNYWYGFSSTIDFYLPNKTGYYETINGEKVYGNQSTHGQDMTFHFSGDDDVWVFVDGKLVLDLGGMHDIVDGDINFSTGQVISAGSVSTLDLSAGRHELTICYMERGASQANCMIYFNIAPRFTLNIEKEDYLNRHLLNGAQFTVFTDEACTEPAQLWPSRAAYMADMADDIAHDYISTFEVVNGQAKLWGFSAGNTYYIKETSPPDGYPIPKGIIKLTMDNVGKSSYEVLDMIEEDGEVVTPGFTAYGFRIDQETEQAYLIITNGDGLLTETTSVLVKKVWNGGTNRPDVPVYLLADGTRIREVTLNESNNWQYTWEDLPVYRSDGNGGQTAITYTVQEGTVPGYVGKVTEYTSGWDEAKTFENGKTYLLYVANKGYLATSGTNFRWLEKSAAETTASAQWTATVNSNGTVKLTNRENQILSYNSSQYFYVGSGGNSENLTFNNNRLSSNSYHLTTSYYTSNRVTYENRLSATWRSSSAAVFALFEETTVDGYGFLITNTPATETTSLTVNKVWMNGDAAADATLYQTLSVPVKLLANGQDTGQKLTLNYGNRWTATFTNLPSKDTNGNTIEYTVVEELDNDNWQAEYSYSGTSATITNRYQMVIPVEKIWGEDVTKLPQSITLNLYSAAGDGQTATLLDTLTLTAANRWQGSFQVAYPGSGQVYYVYEPSGEFSASYSNPTEIFIDDVRRTAAKVAFTDDAQLQPTTVTVTNQMLYALPETGGTGTYLYTGAGLLLMLISMAFLLYKYKKRRKEVY